MLSPITDAVRSPRPVPRSERGEQLLARPARRLHPVLGQAEDPQASRRDRGRGRGVRVAVAAQLDDHLDELHAAGAVEVGAAGQGGVRRLQLGPVRPEAVEPGLLHLVGEVERADVVRRGQQRPDVDRGQGVEGGEPVVVGQSARRRTRGWAAPRSRAARAGSRPCRRSGSRARPAGRRPARRSRASRCRRSRARRTARPPRRGSARAARGRRAGAASRAGGPPGPPAVSCSRGSTRSMSAR